MMRRGTVIVPLRKLSGQVRPISINQSPCHLYPIRIGDYGPYKAVNYHRWNVCKAAVLLGKKENLPVYKFLKEPLVRKFGEEWYKELEVAAEGIEEKRNDLSILSGLIIP